MGKISFFIIAIIFLLIFGGIYFFSKKEKGVVCLQDVKECPDGSFISRVPPRCEFAPCPEQKEYKKVLLYYYRPEKDKDETGNTKCSRDGLTAIEKEIPLSQTPIQDTIKLLLKGKENLTPDDISQGITTEYPLEGLKLKSANLKPEGTLILEFEDLLNKTVGGACRVGILWFQIETTAKQFAEVKKVQFLPEELFQP